MILDSTLQCMLQFHGTLSKADVAENSGAGVAERQRTGERGTHKYPRATERLKCRSHTAIML